MNPHDRIDHKILSLARLPVPTLLHLAYVFTFEQSHTLRTYPGHLKQQCRRWDLNPHDRIDHKILSLARLPIPTLLHVNFSMSVVQTIYYHPSEQMSTLFSIFYSICKSQYSAHLFLLSTFCTNSICFFVPLAQSLYLKQLFLK